MTLPRPLTQPAGASPEFLGAFRAHADADGTMTFARFMELALYDPAVGYYRRPGLRVGYARGTDFFTASTSGSLFGELVAAACVKLLGDADPREYTFVEIGVEPALAGAATSPGILAGVEHPFAAVRAIGLGEAIKVHGRCVVFSNELFDAQPFRRFVFRQGSWHEVGVRLQDGVLNPVDLPAVAPFYLPESAVEEYVIDLPVAARELAGKIAGEPWTGLFVTADYGKSWRELVEATPGGTARAYFRHTQSNDILARPGEQDLTCHVCWNWLADELGQHGFGAIQVESQEAFFINHAATFIATTSATEAAHFSRRKLSLLQLLHPAHLGQKFQILHARR